MYRILFRYHKSYDLCIQNLKNLRLNNPEMNIDGLFGGSQADFQTIPLELTNLLDTNWCLPLDDPYYKWKNGDLCVRWWYKTIGKDLDFSHIFLIEWDWYVFEPLLSIYPKIKDSCNYASIFGDYAYAKKIDWHWIIYTYSYELSLIQNIFETKGYKFMPEALSFGIMGGAVLCREFLDRYIAEDVPSYSNDELRLSVYSYAYDIPLIDNLIYKNPNNLIDADGKIFTSADYWKVQNQGGTVIHPFREILQSDGQTN